MKPQPANCPADKRTGGRSIAADGGYPCKSGAWRLRSITENNPDLARREATPAASACWQCWRPDARSAVEHRPADVVPQPLVVEYELANRLRELVALPPALESPCALALFFWVITLTPTYRPLRGQFFSPFHGAHSPALICWAALWARPGFSSERKLDIIIEIKRQGINLDVPFIFILLEFGKFFICFSLKFLQNW